MSKCDSSISTSIASSAGTARTAVDPRTLVDTSAKRQAYMKEMIERLVVALGPHPTGSKEMEIAQEIYLNEMRRAIPQAACDRHWTEWKEIYPGAVLVLDGHCPIDVKTSEGSAPTPVKGHWGVIQRFGRDGIPFALVDEASGKVLVHIEVSPSAGPVMGYMVDQYTLKVPRFNIGREDLPRLEEAIANRRPAWAYLQAIYYPQTVSNNIVATIPGESAEEILFVAHLDVHPIAMGAGDDTGSAIIQLMLAHALAGTPLKRPVTFLASGSHEINSGGVQHYIKKRQLDGTIDDIEFLFIVDAVAVGPHFNTHTRDRGLKDLIKQIHTDLKIEVEPTFRDQPAHMNDGWFFRETTHARAAYLDSPAAEGRFDGPWHHTTRDTPEIIDYHGAEIAFLFMRELILRLQDL